MWFCSALNKPSTKPMSWNCRESESDASDGSMSRAADNNKPDLHHVTGNCWKLQIYITLDPLIDSVLSWACVHTIHLDKDFVYLMVKTYLLVFSYKNLDFRTMLWENVKKPFRHCAHDSRQIFNFFCTFMDFDGKSWNNFQISRFFFFIRTVSCNKNNIFADYYIYILYTVYIFALNSKFYEN